MGQRMQPNQTDETKDKKFMRFDDSKKHSDDNFTLLNKKTSHYWGKKHIEKPGTLTTSTRQNYVKNMIHISQNVDMLTVDVQHIRFDNFGFLQNSEQNIKRKISRIFVYSLVCVGEFTLAL